VTQADDGRIGTLVHAADLHLGAPISGLYGHLDDKYVQELIDIASEAFKNLVDATIEKEADILVLAGDIYDGGENEYRIQNNFRNGLQKLVNEKVKVFIVHGNHDPIVKKQKLLELPEGVHVFDSGKPQLEEVILNGTKIEVAGVSFETQHETGNLALLFHDLKPENPKLTVGILHTNVGGSTSGHGDYAPCSKEDLQNAPIGYWALGHIHKRTEPPEALPNGGYWAYSGNLQGRSVKSSECEPKGALEVPIMPDGFGEPRFFPCNTVRFNRIEVDATGIETQDDVYEEVKEKVEESRLEENCPVLSRVEIKGRTKAHKDLMKSNLSGDLVEGIREKIRDNPLKDGLVLKVELKTQPPVDLEEWRDSEDFGATLIKCFDDFRAELSFDDVEKELNLIDSKIDMTVVSQNSEQILDRALQILIDRWGGRNE
jgi:DNA repair exonuclease SbcCD nuclease subunit